MQPQSSNNDRADLDIRARYARSRICYTFEQEQPEGISWNFRIIKRWSLQSCLRFRLASGPKSRKPSVSEPAAFL